MGANPGDPLRAFLESDSIGVAGASADPQKFGYKVLQHLIESGRNAIPVNPGRDRILGIECVPTPGDLPEECKALSVITPPAVTESLVENAVGSPIKLIWMQPGAESVAAIDRARLAGIEVISGGPCILVSLATESRKESE